MCFADYIVDAACASVLLIGIYILIGTVDRKKIFVCVPIIVGAYALMDFCVRQGTVVTGFLAAWMEISVMLISVGYLAQGNIWKNFTYVFIFYTMSSIALTLVLQLNASFQAAYIKTITYQYITPFYGIVIAVFQILAAAICLWIAKKFITTFMRFVPENICKLVTMVLYVTGPVFYFLKSGMILEQTFHMSETKMPYWLLLILCTIFHLVQFEIVALILSKVQQGHIKRENKAREIAIEKEMQFVSDLRTQNRLLQEDASELLKKKKLLSVSGNLDVDYILLEVEKKIQDMGGVLQTSIAPIKQISIDEMEMFLLLEQLTSFGLEQMAQTAGKDKWMNLVIRVHHKMLIVKMEFTKARQKRDIRYEKNMKHVISLTRHANGYFDYREKNCIGELSIMIP